VADSPESEPAAEHLVDRLRAEAETERAASRAVGPGPTKRKRWVWILIAVITLVIIGRMAEDSLVDKCRDASNRGDAKTYVESGCAPGIKP
jgi:predicted dinucleotide-utilizing enzyme